jgi:hypothetical protein
MGFIVGLVVGIAIGWAIAYVLSKQKAETQASVIQDLKRQFDLAESEHDRRLREATTRLQKDYDQQLQEAQMRTAAAQATPASPAASASEATPLVSPPPVSPPADALPTPTPAPKAPKTPAIPLTATAPAPTPQAVAKSPPIPNSLRGKHSDQRRVSHQANNPHALLANSYAPEAAKRSEVAQAIAASWPTAGPKEQASWLPILTRLGRDADPRVRLQAVQALSNVKSSKRLPLLRRALRDPDPAVMQAANDIVSQLKGRSPRPAQPTKRRLPKNR